MRWLFLLFFCTSTVFSNKPWLPDPYDMTWDLSGGYFFYPEIADAVQKGGGSSFQYLVESSLSFTTTSSWSFLGQIVCDQTTRNAFGLANLLVSAEKQWLDDIRGDLFSLTTGLKGRFVPKKQLLDPVNPYHALVNGEFFLSAGKEVSNCKDWLFRFYGQLSLDGGIKGYPRLIESIHCDGKVNSQWSGGIALLNQNGFGKKREIDLNHFDGYGNIRYQSVDVQLHLTHHFFSWGALTLEGNYRPYAAFYPAKRWGVMISYALPIAL